MVELYGLVVSVFEPPVKPDTPERSGNATEAMPDSASAAVAFSWNEPVAAGWKYSVLVPAS